MQSIHQKTIDLLPWLINGTLPENERKAVEAHLKQCLPCRAALKDEQQLAARVRQQNELPVSAGHGVADLLTKLNGRRPSVAKINFRPRLAVAMVAIGLTLTTALIVSNRGDEELGARSGAFTTLTNSGESTGDRLDIVFDETISSGEIDRIIAAVGGQIVDGPTDLGRYTVAVSPGDLDTAIEQLQGDPRIRFVGKNFIGAAENR